MAPEVVVVSALRSAFGKLGGSLKDTPAVSLAADLMKKILGRANVDPREVDEIILGNAGQASTGGMGPVVARQALLTANFPPGVVSVTLDRACCSGLTSVGFGFRTIKSGEAQVILAGGVEVMSQTPLLLKQARWGKRLGSQVLEDPLVLSYFGEPIAKYTGLSAIKQGVDRAEQDWWALTSQQRYAGAEKQRKFEEEIVPVKVSSKGQEILFEKDESPRPSTTLEKLAELPTVYGSPTITPGNAPSLNDGGAMVLLMSREKAEDMGLRPLATILSYTGICGDPKESPGVPGLAVKKVLGKSRLSLSGIDLLEINEAFAAVPLVSTKILGEDDPAKIRDLREKTNVNGGAIAIGHPLAASGSRILMSLINELRRRGGGVGVAAICGGLSQGDAAVIRVE